MTTIYYREHVIGDVTVDATNNPRDVHVTSFQYWTEGPISAMGTSSNVVLAALRGGYTPISVQTQAMRIDDLHDSVQLWIGEQGATLDDFKITLNSTVIHEYEQYRENGKWHNDLIKGPSAKRLRRELEIMALTDAQAINFKMTFMDFVDKYCQKSDLPYQMF
jgi:hypothetical protein